ALALLFFWTHKMSAPLPESPKSFHFKFETLKGYFAQSEDETDDSQFDFLKEGFGLLNRVYDTDDDDEKEQGQWPRFEKFVRNLNERSGEGESIKVLFLGRHGQGWHNVAESKYGTKNWDCYYSMLDGADGMTWSDAVLTEVGQGQAKDVHGLWQKLLPEGIPAPETYYVSPLTRTIQTADLSFKGLALPDDKLYRPYIKELLREALGVHTCDRRSTASHILKEFPHITLEPNFSEPDVLWQANYREPRAARRYRLAQLLDDIFANDDNVFLSLTSHSGAIRSILTAFGHRDFALQTGGVIPVLVKARRVEGERKKPPKEPSEAP
ncbi:phosphoglycerate mutase-like protein, partial [Bimuria novae-zelandiae CBS 107.79]